MNIEIFRLKNSKICLEFIYGSEINLKKTYSAEGTFLPVYSYTDVRWVVYWSVGALYVRCVLMT